MPPGRRHPFKVLPQAGFTPHDILRTATAAVGRDCHAHDRLGLVTAGDRADRLLLEANPLADLGQGARCAGVGLRGRWIPRSAVQPRPAAIAASVR